MKECHPQRINPHSILKRWYMYSRFKSCQYPNVKCRQGFWNKFNNNEHKITAEPRLLTRKRVRLSIAMLPYLHIWAMSYRRGEWNILSEAAGCGVVSSLVRLAIVVDSLRWSSVVEELSGCGLIVSIVTVSLWSPADEVMSWWACELADPLPTPWSIWRIASLCACISSKRSSIEWFVRKPLSSELYWFCRYCRIPLVSHNSDFSEKENRII